MAYKVGIRIAAYGLQIRGPRDHINRRILQTMISGILLVLGLGTRMSDPSVYIVPYHTIPEYHIITYHIILYHIIIYHTNTIRILTFMLFFGPLEFSLEVPLFLVLYPKGA